MEIQLDKSTLPQDGQPVRFCAVGSSEWKEGHYDAEAEYFYEGKEHLGAWSVEEWEALEASRTEGEQLRQHRISMGHTQAEYAAILGLSRDSTISDWENSKKPVPGFMQYIMRLEKENRALKKGRVGY